MPDTFEGYSEDSLSFLATLRENNDTGWFNAHKIDYQELLLEPARLFVEALGDELKKIAPDVHAEPKVNRSLFRINRDTRFSKDKNPYKTHHAVWFWEGVGPRMECSGFYFHMDPEKLLLGVGLHTFPKDLLAAYRKRVDNRATGETLANIIDTLTSQGAPVGGLHYKRVPRGMDADHPRADLLKHNGLYAGFESPIPDELYSGDLIAYCMERYRMTLPLHRWLLETTDAV